MVLLGIWSVWSGSLLLGESAMRFLRFLALLALFYLAYRVLEPLARRNYSGACAIA